MWPKQHKTETIILVIVCKWLINNRWLCIGDSLMALFQRSCETTASNAVHRELTRDGKSRLMRFCKEYTDLARLQNLVSVIHALRHYLNLPALQ